MRKREYLPYLKTLRRIPDDIILSMGVREFHMDDATTCICGWALREGMSKVLNETADELNHYDAPAPSGEIMPGTPSRCVAMFGGDHRSWHNIFIGVTNSQLPAIELAFVVRMDEAVSHV